MTEKDYIEDIIKNNLSELNSEEPATGHFERFEARLALDNKNKFKLNTIWKAAAAVVILLLALNQGYIYLTPGTHTSLLNVFEKNEISLASVSPEYREVEMYYNTAINSGINQWNGFAREGLVSEEEQQIMKTELDDFENRFKTLQADLAKNPNDERVINAMLEYYQSKLNVINLIITKLEEVKQKQKNNNHETNI